ncbi:YczE/YyaS/YitT family protein [Rhodocista pekingensis]|uniref:YitT family protein n=1 Tax=Rhodocista pekingensis TaxID=201185 RepID=A0ABW2L0T2_9PROT
MTRPVSAPLPGRLALYLSGCLLFSLGAKLFIDSHLGVDPLDVLVLGIVGHTGVTVGIASGAVAIGFLLLWSLWNRRRPPLSPFMTMFLVGSLIDLWIWLELERVTQAILAAVPMLATGLLLASFGSALIIVAGIGIRIMDLVAITMVERWRWQFWQAKLALEVFFVASGWVLGGPVGVGTLAFVVVVGPMMQLFMALVTKVLGTVNHGLPGPLASAHTDAARPDAAHPDAAGPAAASGR